MGLVNINKFIKSDFIPIKVASHFHETIIDPYIEPYIGKMPQSNAGSESKPLKYTASSENPQIPATEYPIINNRREIDMSPQVNLLLTEGSTPTVQGTHFLSIFSDLK